MEATPKTGCVSKKNQTSACPGKGCFSNRFLGQGHLLAEGAKIIKIIPHLGDISSVPRG
jgi:hypothetical protein